MKRTNFHLEEAQAQKLRQALITIQRLRTVDVKNPIIMFPDEYYFVERTLIELGYLKPNKNQCAHTRFLNLMDELQVPFRIGRPTLDQLRVAANHICIVVNVSYNPNPPSSRPYRHFCANSLGRNMVQLVKKHPFP